ncbi:MAG: ABC transporter permease [Cryobacterium sp.]|nr:ABC transporter permease [Cryobacterium sp.]
MLRRVLFAVGLPVILVTLWWFVSAGSTSFFWPPLRAIVETFPETWLSGRLLSDVVPSLVRLFIGYGVALAIGIVAGVALGLSRTLRDYAEPTLEFLRAMPPPVLVPVIMLFAGIGDEMKVAVIALGCIWPVLLNTVEGVRAIDEVLADTARSYRLSVPTRLMTLVLRSASPQIVTGARQSLSVGIILMVISEMFAASNGLGFAIVQFQRGFEMPEMWSGVLLLGLIGVILSVIFRAFEAWVLRWYLSIQRIEQRV